mgnify:CR=1 FL=1
MARRGIALVVAGAIDGIAARPAPTRTDPQHAALLNGLFTRFDVAAQELGIAPERIDVIVDTTRELGFGQTTGSRGTLMAAGSVQQAAALLEPSFDQLEQRRRNGAEDQVDQGQANQHIEQLQDHGVAFGGEGGFGHQTSSTRGSTRPWYCLIWRISGSLPVCWQSPARAVARVLAAGRS